MGYRVYSGEFRARGTSPLDRSRKPYTEFDRPEDALLWAQRLREHGRVALLVVGDDGTRLGQQEIADAIGSGTGARKENPAA